MKNLIFIICFLLFFNSNAQKYPIIKSEITNLFEYINVYDYDISNNKIEQSKIISKTNFETILINKIKEKNANFTDKEIVSLIELKTKFKIIYDNHTHVFIKYKLKKIADNKEYIEVIDIVYNGLEYKENNIKDDISLAVEKILKYVNANILFEFYSNEDKLKFKDIKNLKIDSKDENGILDIFKLAEVIEKNKLLLSKYLDN